MIDVPSLLIPLALSKAFGHYAARFFYDRRAVGFLSSKGPLTR